MARTNYSPYEILHCGIGKCDQVSICLFFEKFVKHGFGECKALGSANKAAQPEVAAIIIYSQHTNDNLCTLAFFNIFAPIKDTFL